jgi:D-tyrosyl-tRNA(Tyr) deacylase
MPAKMMRAVVQRVKSASVTVERKLVSEIRGGLLIFLGVAQEDTSADVDYLANKIANLRIFEDDEGRMNRSLLDVGGEALVVSQFTLYGDCRKGRRPSFIAAARPEKADALYQEFMDAITQIGVPVKAGVFQAMMDVGLVNDGPVTMMLDSSKLF